MAAWFSVYGSRSFVAVTAADLTAALERVDFYTVAEGFGFDDEVVVDEMLSNLCIESVDQPLGVRFHIQYRAGNARPLLVHMWTEPEQVREMCAEAKEELTDDRRRGASRVRSHMAQVVEIAAVELGISQLEDIGLVLGGQMAEYLAEVGDGLICDPADEWWAISRGVPRCILKSGRLTE